MIILYLHQYFKTPEMQGGTRSYEMARRMVAAGHEVHMVSSRPSDGRGRRWVEETVDGIHVHWLSVDYDNSMGLYRRLAAFGAFAREAASYAAQLDADVVFATSTPLTIALPGVKASRAQGVPLIFEVRDLWPEVPIAMGALDLPFAKSLARRLEKWAYRNSAFVIGLSPGMCEGIARAGYPPDRMTCIPNSADLELFQVSPAVGTAFRKARTWLQNRPLVLYAGTFGRVNGVGYMVELAKEMRLINPEVMFLAVGEGAEKSAIEEKAARLGVLNHNFYIEPSVPKRDIPALFSAATVCSSWVIDLEVLWHNSANKVFDGFAAGRPVVINHEGWQKELLEGELAGLSLPPRDVSLAAQKLNAFLSDPKAISTASASALRLAQTRFSRDALASQLIRIIEDVVAEHAVQTAL